MIKVMHGDSKEILKTLNFTDKTIIVTDPPFNISYGYKTYNDKMPEQAYWEMLKCLFQDRKCVVIHYSEQLHRLSIELQTAPTKTVSWVYNSNTAKQHREIAFYNIQPDFKQVGQAYKNPTDKRIAKRIADGKSARLYDWWEINQVKNVSKDKTEHPCQMPLEVMKRIIAILPEDKLIVDPFGGSGTTALACKELNRKCIIIEQDEKYIGIINERLK